MNWQFGVVNIRHMFRDVNWRQFSCRARWYDLDWSSRQWDLILQLDWRRWCWLWSRVTQFLDNFLCVWRAWRVTQFDLQLGNFGSAYADFLDTNLGIPITGQFCIQQFGASFWYDLDTTLIWIWPQMVWIDYHYTLWRRTILVTRHCLAHFWSAFLTIWYNWLMPFDTIWRAQIWYLFPSMAKLALN